MDEALDRHYRSLNDLARATGEDSFDAASDQKKLGICKLWIGQICELLLGQPQWIKQELARQIDDDIVKFIKALEKGNKVDDIINAVEQARATLLTVLDRFHEQELAALEDQDIYVTQRFKHLLEFRNLLNIASEYVAASDPQIFRLIDPLSPATSKPESIIRSSSNPIKDDSDLEATLPTPPTGLDFPQPPVIPTTKFNKAHEIKLRNAILKMYDRKSKLKLLCNDLDFPYKKLEKGNLETKIASLIKQLKAKGKYPELVKTVLNEYEGLKADLQ